MAVEAGFTQIAMNIADAIHEYAKARKWDKSDYHIFITSNRDIYTLRILIVARFFEGRTEQQEYQDYSEVTDFIESRAKSELRALNSYGLVLAGTDGFSFHSAPRLGPAEFEIDERLINHGISWSDPAHQANR